MSLQSIARTALASIATIAGNGVTVIYNGETATNCPRNTFTHGTGADVFGEEGYSSGVVHVDASALSKPERGATILIDGAAAIVTQVISDPVSAMWRIEYQDQREVSGV